MAILLLFIETILVTVIMIGSLVGILSNPISPGILTAFWFASILALIGSITLRKFYKRRYKKEIAIREKSPLLEGNEFFY